MSAVAVSVEKGVITTNSQMDGDVIKAIAKNSRKNVLLVDSSKFNKSAYISILPLTDFSEIVTDSGISKENARIIKSSGVKLSIV